MTTTRSTSIRLPLAVGTALAATLLAGCASTGMMTKAETPDVSAQAALDKGKIDRAVNLAEDAVAASPNNAASRALLAQAYFKAGRFASAARTFDDAVKLGDKSPETQLNLALARIGAGDQQGALELLDESNPDLESSDLGLSLALAGEPRRGVAVLVDALRNGENTPKVRQNLAYAYALAGRWQEARVMASQDIAADKVGERMAEWAETILPEQNHERMAMLLDVPVRDDPGQPAKLALGGAAAAGQVAVATPVQPAFNPNAELPAVDAPASAKPSLALVDSTAKPSAPSVVAAQPVAHVAPKPVAPVKLAVNSPIAAKPASAAKGRPAATGTHFVQLGSFSSQENARKAWSVYTAKNPALGAYRMTITQANVGGKAVWRVAAGGVQGNAVANNLCSQIKSKGGACFAYAAPSGTTSPAAPDRTISGPQLARRR
jgi:Flp pilus assembly protein TadD